VGGAENVKKTKTPNKPSHNGEDGVEGDVGNAHFLGAQKTLAVV
jgi:hypothetical protein